MKLLWGNSAGRCSFSKCSIKLTSSNHINEVGCIIGEMAHIAGAKETANRHDRTMSAKQRDDYRNLILLCPTHHTLIDKNESESKFTTADLLEMKAAHE